MSAIRTRSSAACASATSTVPISGHIAGTDHRHAAAARHQRRRRNGRARPAIDVTVAEGEPAKSMLVRAADRGRQRVRRHLAPEHRPDDALQRGGRSAADDAGRQLERGSRERAAVRRDAAAADRDQRARRRAGDHQQRPAGPRREAGHAGDVRPRRRQDPRDLRRPGRRRSACTTSSDQMVRYRRTFDERGERLRRRGRRRWAHGQGGRRVDARRLWSSTMSTKWQRSEGVESVVTVGELTKSVVFAPLFGGQRHLGQHHPPEHRSNRRIQRGRRPAADDARRQPERRPRERPAVRRDTAAADRDQRARRRAGDHQQRPGRARREARHAVDVRPRRRQDPGDLRRPGRRHRSLRLRERASRASRTRSRRASGSSTRRRRSPANTTRQFVSTRAAKPLVIDDVEAVDAERRASTFSLVGRAVEVDGLRAADQRRQGLRPHLAPEPRSGTRAFSEADVRLLDDACVEPQRGAGERATVRRDAAPADRDQRARRRAGDHQQRPGGPRGAARHAGDVRPGRRQDPRDLRRAGRSTSASTTSTRETVTYPVHDRARRALARCSELPIRRR